MNTRDVSLTGIPHIGRATVIGALLGALSVAVPVTVAMIAFGAGPLSVLFGAHVGIFGGMGYGGMLGAVIRSDRWENTTEGGINHDRDTAGGSQPAHRAA